MKTAQRTILYVEDDADDRNFFCDALRQTHPEIEIVEVENGQEAMDYLKDVTSEQDLPSLIVLDINMPIMDGKEMLTLMSIDPTLHRVPVVVFTSSENPEDKHYIKDYGVALINKPYNIGNMPALVENMLAYCA